MSNSSGININFQIPSEIKQGDSDASSYSDHDSQSSPSEGKESAKKLNA